MAGTDVNDFILLLLKTYGFEFRFFIKEFFFFTVEKIFFYRLKAKCVRLISQVPIAKSIFFKFHKCNNKIICSCFSLGLGIGFVKLQQKTNVNVHFVFFLLVSLFV